MTYSTASEIEAAIEQLVTARTLLIALDFDGTLAPEVDDPLEARAIPAAQEQLLRMLDFADTRLALVSGRAIDSLEHVAHLGDRVLFGGSHGLEYRLDEGDSPLPMSAENTAALERLDALMHELADSAEGAWVELKPAGRALHVRMTSAEDAERLTNEAVTRVETDIPGLTTRFGKNIVEFAIHDADKGDAIKRLRDYTGADAVFFAGDDTTDEDAILVLGPNDLGVRVGDAPSAAQLRVAGTAEIAQVLAILADRREAVVSARTN
ncbi:trehalose 6-phosphatase [Salinibacterium amurskyense]|uniref:Trehalose 6-phosphate phosphatase n=1 Tax=Salinibacterium amurskyense TaxID=205941 RepID=A0A2M9D824_9MICO|nr:trehalose-phosphatase [Salinibacterium amurskyense]PJJ81854.1 trehalose 6-phosphatase [Salinibacterium amurskyense]RLQ81653.1 trehalose-phosphatase [Salinibacterium amurskyense]GHD79070.1 trehalose 6-phosphate phosphatase [Salinibacterium amurskyense]